MSPTEVGNKAGEGYSFTGATGQCPLYVMKKVETCDGKHPNGSECGYAEEGKCSLKKGEEIG